MKGAVPGVTVGALHFRHKPGACAETWSAAHVKLHAKIKAPCRVCERESCHSHICGAHSQHGGNIRGPSSLGHVPHVATR